MSGKSLASDIFLSYSRQDREFASRLADALRARGFSIWWDSHIPMGVPYVKYIESGLKSARCVVVLWSRASIKSRWVRNEADWAAENELLVPVLIEDTELPWEFRNFQTLNLCSWKGQETEEFTLLVDGLRKRIQGNPPTHDPNIPAEAQGKWQHKDRQSHISRRIPMAMGVILVLVVLGFWFVKHSVRTSDREGPEPWLFTHTPLTGDGKTRSSAISPDGSFLVYTHEANGRFELRLKQIDTGRETRIVPAGEYGIRSPVFAPDGNFIYFAQAGPHYRMDHLAEYDLYRVPLLGGTPQKLATRIIGRRFAVAPDGRRLVYKRSDGDSLRVIVKDLTGGEERIVGTQPRDITVRCCLAWSADGSRIYTTGRDTTSGELQVMALFTASGGWTLFSGGGWQAILDIQTLADGSGLLVLGLPAAQLTDLNINLYYLPANSDEVRALTDDITLYYQVSADRSGRKLVLNYYAVRSILRVHGADSLTRFRNVSADIVPNGRVIWTSAGHLLANLRVGDRVGLVYLSTKGDIVEQVSTEAQYIVGMDLSQDGTTLAYTSFQGKEISIWLSDAHGGTPRRLATGEGNQRYPVFGPNGDWLIYCCQTNANEPYYLKRISLTDGLSTRLMEVPALLPRLSPDGKTVEVAVLDLQAGGYVPALVPSGGGMPTYPDLAAGYQVLGWNQDGSGLVCAKKDKGIMNLWDIPIQGGTPRPLTDYTLDNIKILDMAWNAARDSFAVDLEETTFDAVLLAREHP